MKYSPKGDSRRAVMLCLLSICTAAILMTVSTQKIMPMLIPQIIALVFVVIALQIYLKYIASEYKYAFDEETLYLDKIVGKRIVPLGALDLSMSLCHVIRKKEYLAAKDKYPKVQIRFNYCKTVFAENPYVYVFTFNEKTALLTFEPSEEFAAELNRIIDRRCAFQTAPTENE